MTPFTLAMTGKAMDYLLDNRDNNVLQKIVNKTSVFARMNPKQKARLVEFIKAKNAAAKNREYVLMCGDGANDCTALKAADAGISLADSEASIAAPFTSKVQDISCVPVLLREGRACLESNIQSFKYIMFYAIGEAFSISVLYLVNTTFFPEQFTYIDLVTVLPIVMI